MDAKDLRTESTLSERKDGSKYSQSGTAQQCNRNKTYQDIGTNPLGKAETAAAVRPCAVIGPDRVLPPPNTNDAYLKKGSIEPWPCPDNIYSQLPDYHHKMSSNPNQMRNISPRQTFQENMPRIMMPPAYNSIKNTTDGSSFNLGQDRAPVLSKNPKPNMASEAKYCDVPYTVNQLSNEHKSFRESEISVPSVNSPLMRTIPHGWSPNSGNLHAPRTYGAHEVYQYQQYPNCVGPRPPILPVGRRHQTFQDEAGYVYPDSYYQDPSIRFKSYPQVKDRYPQPRFDYIGNYSNPYHPPPTFPPHKYDIPKSGTAHQYPVYPHLKYLDNRGSDPTIDVYQRPSNQPPPGYNMPFRNQVIHPSYSGVANAQAKVLPYPLDSTGKPIVSNKPPYDSNKLYIDYDNARNKSYAVNDPYFLNDINRIQPAKNQIMPPNYPTVSMHQHPNQQFLRKDIHMKSHEFMPHFRNFDPSVGSYMIRHPSHFSPNTIAISPTDSNTSNDTTQTQGTNQEDCGYVSQSSSASVRSVESGVNRMSHEYYKRHDYRYGPIGNTHMQSKHEVKGKKQIDVRQFLQMWNEGDDENGENNNKESIAQTSTSNVKQDNKQEQLYVLGLVNVPSEELSKYEHIQTVSKLPEHIKGYNSIELLKQYEEVVESSNINSFKSPVSKNFQMPLRDNRNTPKQVVEVLPRPISPLDVEAKISQSVIHKEVGCNFEIKPCSPKMLNVEIPAPIQNVLGERVIEKVSNPLSNATESSISVQTDDDSLHNNLKRQTSHSSYEKSSCKILGSPFAPHNLDSVKTDYTIQDLEINSGVCLASLPRLDNEIELNFPEVNQQFIDANKIDNNVSNDEKSKIKESDSVVEFNSSKENVTGSENIKEQNITFSQDDSLKEHTRLNKYRKSNSSAPSENAMTAVRTDSVIIMNPETLRNVSNSPRNDHSNFISEETHVPVNLTSDIDVNYGTKNPADLKNNQDKTEAYVAIDFSLNKNDVDKSNKVPKKSKVRTAKQIEHKVTTNNYIEVPSSDANHKNKHIHESKDEADIKEKEIYNKESNSSSYLPNITSEEIDSLNDYSCKADFDDVMKKLTANDFEMTSEINLESNNIITNSNDVIGKLSRSDIDEQDFKSRCNIYPNEGYFTLSQKSTKHNNNAEDILIKKEKCIQNSKEHRYLDTNESKLKEHIEPKQHEDSKHSDEENLREENIDPSEHKSTKFEKIDTDSFIQEVQSVKVRQLAETEDVSTNNLSEKDNTISTEFEKSDITEVNQSTVPKSQQTGNENFNTDQLTEEKESKKIEQLMKIKNVSTNSLYDKDETKECNIFHLGMLIKKEGFTIPKQTEHTHFNSGKEEQKLKETMNTLTEDDQSMSLEIQIKENKTLDSNVILSEATPEPHKIQEIITCKGDQNALLKQQIGNFAKDTLIDVAKYTITKTPSQENIKLDAEREQHKNLQQNFTIPTTLEKIEMDVVSKKDNSLKLTNSPFENETFGEDLLVKNEHARMQEQHLEKADTITENSNLDTNFLEIKTQRQENKSVRTTDALVEEDQNILQNKISQLSSKNNSFDTEILVDRQNADTEKQHDDNQSVKSSEVTEENQSVSLNERPQLLTDYSNFDTKILIDQENTETKIKRQDNQSINTGAITEEDQIMLQDERRELLIENSNLDTDMQVDQQNVKEIQHKDSKSVNTDAITEEDQSSISQDDSPQLLSTENSNSDTEMLVDQQHLEAKIQFEDNKCVGTCAITEDPNMSQNERSQLSTENSNFDIEILVHQQNVKTPILMENENNKRVDAVIEENQSVPEKLQSEDENNSDSVMPIEEEEEEGFTPSHLMQRSCLKNRYSLENCTIDNSSELQNIPLLAASLPIDSNNSKEQLQNYISNRDEDVEHYIDCNFKLFKPVYKNNNSFYKIKLYSPQIQKLIVHIEGFINYKNSIKKPTETILNDKFFEKVEGTNEIFDLESRIVELPNISEISFEVKTGSVETSERQNKDSESLLPVKTKPLVTSAGEHIIESVTRETNILSSKSQFEFDEKCDSTKAINIELDTNTNYSINEEVTSLLAIKNLETSNTNVMINDLPVNTECKNIDHELRLSKCDNISATSECNNGTSQKSRNIDYHDSQNPACKNIDSDETNMSDLQYVLKIEGEINDVDKTLHHNITNVTSQKNNMTLATTHDNSFATAEIDQETVVYTFDKNIPEVRDSDENNDSWKVRHTSLKRSLSDSALNAYGQDNNKEFSWPSKRRKIDENTLEQNIINESICRLIQASRRNSISSFENEENVSFCILIDDTCILTEENEQDKICYAEVTESDTINQNEDNVVTGSSFPPNDIELLTTDTVIYECQEEGENEAVNEGPWVEDIACIETVGCENVVEELVMSSSPSSKHNYNDTVISENVAEDVIISSPSSIKCFEDDFVNVAPTFNHDWVETLVDEGVAEDVVISSFLTTKEDCLEGEIRTNLEETIANSPSNLKGNWNEIVDDDMGVGSVLTHRERWDETLVNVNVADDVVANCRASAKYNCLETRVKINDEEDEDVLIKSSPKNYAIETEVKENDTRNTMDSPLTPKHSNSFKRVVKVTDVMITDSPSSSKDHIEYDDDELSCYNVHEHANKVKSIYGEGMTDGDAQIVDTLFRTPQMDVNKTLLHDPLELDISAKLSHMEYSDDSLSESPLQKRSLCIFSEYSDCKFIESDITNRNTYQKENIVTDKSTSRSTACHGSSDTDNSFTAKCIPQDKTVHSCESSADNVFTYDDSNYTSSSPEVSSTTSEDRNSGILLKITNLNGSRISQINEIKSDLKPRCKFTEKKDYSSNRFPNRPLITKAAQKYIPPVKESIRDLKVKISLPPQSLLKFKELKLSRNITKIPNKQSISNIPKIPKKPKPLFEDVLKSIDEIQIKMHKEKKKPKTTVPKVVIKKNEYGSHYASTPTKETFNPDLTGRKWQPWVFIERNNLIDKMALKNKTRAVFNHRKKCYVLAEKFKKYKSAVSNTKFVISRPSSIKSTGQLKYTIRLKHSY